MGGFTSIWHWVIVLLVIVLLFGAKKIPELAKGLGSGIKNFKKAVKDDEEEAKNELKTLDAQATQTKVHETSEIKSKQES
ncbi:twin-arginine translocase TatA/TatE family subunit [Helicobacter pylori]|uniref:Sec-independent protein translocase protein TatA n=1 Tax=Helicobacter pylori (strain J99 / ATCC 700824) TaxID=85963 RepID=TATA_HELPJ|nr:twin-arginine translocase TatA/TatE family subunit [Helicobacter pylori]Q9ZMB8.1 RecName: Full=Sec-independent protein translocase protein TatA [Helicobacter pylori J99]AAD05888.1 putative [Helicobacter pylori J99]AKE81695.1 preprotein translocase subunit TatA [Helicobacter pylori J99]AVL48924.1 twin-arginine translocase TatA/TatE family subunit [Helicobacter pylori]MWR19110.1 twin-arginine translocase TatA/TatE family subunit [Helicobacter pylori]MWR34873.1 twin-arginine translocase TatA/